MTERDKNEYAHNLEERCFSNKIAERDNKIEDTH